MPDMTQAQHTAQLGFLKQYLDARGWTSQLIEQGVEVPVSVLLVAAPRDRHGRERSIALAYIPTSEEDLEHISLLQFYSPLPFTLDPHYVHEVDALLTVINAGLPIGHFGHKDDRELYHKHVFVAPQRQMIAEDLFVETTLLFFGMQDSFGDAIEAVATGKKTVAETLARLKIAPLPTRVSHTSAAPATLSQRITEYLEAISWPFSPVLDSAFVAQVNGQNGSYTCFAQARESDQQLIFYSVSPLETPPDRLAEMMAFITRANYGLFLGNFELDMDDGEIRFKTSIGVKDDALTPALIGQVIYPGVATMDRYFPGIRAIIEERASAEQAIALVEAWHGRN